jgi:hypothetical protein
MPCVKEGRGSRILPPPPDTGAVVNFRDNWERLVGPLTGEVSAILQGLLNLPRTSHEARRSFKKNHPSFQDDPRAHEILGPKAAGWLYHGILEYCPAEFPPAFVEPIGAVPKKPDSLRMINDGREGNKDMAAWPVRYISPKEVAFIGDDRNDTEVMKAVGLAVCPASAVAAIKSISDIVLSRKGGAACVREFIDNYLS